MKNIKNNLPQEIGDEFDFNGIKLEVVPGTDSLDDCQRCYFKHVHFDKEMYNCDYDSQICELREKYDLGEEPYIIYQKAKSEKKRVYLSGKITGYSKAGDDFKHAENVARRRFGNVEIVNPLKLGKCETYAEYLLQDLKELATCDIILMLRNWNSSPGARVERMFAAACGIRIEDV